MSRTLLFSTGAVFVFVVIAIARRFRDLRCGARVVIFVVIVHGRAIAERSVVRVRVAQRCTTHVNTDSSCVLRARDVALRYCAASVVRVVLVLLLLRARLRK